MHMPSRDTEVGMVVTYHLGGHLEAWVGVVGFGERRE